MTNTYLSMVEQELKEETKVPDVKKAIEYYIALEANEFSGINKFYLDPMVSGVAIEKNKFGGSSNLIESVSVGYDKCLDLCQKLHPRDPYKASPKYFYCEFECITPFLEPNIPYDCISDAYFVKEMYPDRYGSDECILYRRNTPTSVKYFNYKQFLSQDTFVDTDDKFLKAVKYYKSVTDGLRECIYGGQEKTSQEIQTCKNKLLTPLYNYEKNGPQTCNKIVSAEYKQELQTQMRVYKVAIKENGWTKSAAEKQMIESIQDFGKKHLCSTDSYKQDLQKLGFNL